MRKFSKSLSEASAWFVIILLLSLSGCALLAPRPKLGEKVCVPLKDVPQELLRRVGDKEALRLTFSFKVKGRKGRSVLRGILFYKRPKDLRVDFLSPWGVTVAELYSSRRGLLLYLPAEGIIYWGGEGRVGEETICLTFYKGGNLPRLIRGEGEGLEFELRVKEVKFNPSLDDEIFSPHLPEGVMYLPLQSFLDLLR